MKLFVGILILAVVAASVYADYRWRQWMAARRRDRTGLDRTGLDRS